MGLRAVGRGEKSYEDRGLRAVAGLLVQVRVIRTQSPSFEKEERTMSIGRSSYLR